MSTATYGDVRLPDRFWSKVHPCPITGCWLWGGGLNRANEGYGKYLHDGRKALAHRVSYAALEQPIAAALQIDHLCRQPCCVNPEHLEPVTGRVNRLRGTGFVAYLATRTHCPVGHEYTPENTTISGGTRTCRACRLVRKRAAYRAANPNPLPRGAANARKTHCPQGHPYDEENTGMHRGRRRCLTCHRAQQSARTGRHSVDTPGPGSVQFGGRSRGRD